MMCKNLKKKEKKMCLELLKLLHCKFFIKIVHQNHELGFINLFLLTSVFF